jgi:hypothetical protein
MGQRTSLDAQPVHVVPVTTPHINSVAISPGAAAALLEMLRAARAERAVTSQSQLAA